MKRSLRALLESAVDYAGTFPPARLELGDAVRSYVRYRAGPQAWMLGRLIVPAAKLDDIEPLLPVRGAVPGGPWALSVILSAEPGRDVGRIQALERRNEGRARIASVETPPLDPARIREEASRMPAGPERFFEVPLDPALGERLEAIRGAGAAAKVRTGGLREDAFPASSDLALFLCECRRLGIPFKATSGLHHPVRGPHPADTPPESPVVLMHGYLNLAVAASLVHAGKAGLDEAAGVLEERSVEAFRFDEDGVEWRGLRVDLAGVAGARSRFFRSFGACSFEEPVEDLERAGLA